MRLRRIEPCDGPVLERVCLAALEASPGAFSSTVGQEAARADEEWAERARAGSPGKSRVNVLAEDGRGVIGLVGTLRHTKSSPTVQLVSTVSAPKGWGEAASCGRPRRAVDGSARGGELVLRSRSDGLQRADGRLDVVDVELAQ